MKLLARIWDDQKKEFLKVTHIDLVNNVLSYERDNLQECNQRFIDECDLHFGYQVEEPQEAKVVEIYEKDIVNFTLEGMDAIGMWQVEEYKDYLIEDKGVLDWVAYNIDCGNAYDVEVVGNDYDRS